MSVAEQLHLEPDEFREVVVTRINSYNEAIDRLERAKPSVDAGVFGEGFSERGDKISSAVDRVYDRTVDRLRARVNQFEEMLRLAADVDGVDHDNAARFNQDV